MEFKKQDLINIMNEIIEEKLVKKNQKYGNSIYNPQTIFNEIGDPELLISVRLDDKMGRLKQLDRSSDKYDSELKEIIGYLLLLINYRKNKNKEIWWEDIEGSTEKPDINRITMEVKEIATFSDIRL